MNGKIAAWCAVAGGAIVVCLAMRFDQMSPAPSAQLHSRTVTDATGKAVSLPSHPARIISLSTSATDTIVRLGAASRLKAIDEYGRIVPGAEGVPCLGRAAALSREAVQAVRGDLAFVWWYQDDAARLLEESGVPVIRMRCARTTDVPAMVRLVGECLGCADKAQGLAQSVSAALQAFPAQATTPRRVYVELYGPFKTMGADTYLNDLIELAGGVNVAAPATGSVLLSPERLIQADPDVILFVDEFATAQSISGRNGMLSLRAVRMGHVRPVSRYCLVAGAGLAEMVERLRELIKE
jgi:iron complex transport system substrate-binding protein